MSSSCERGRAVYDEAGGQGAAGNPEPVAWGVWYGRAGRPDARRVAAPQRRGRLSRPRPRAEERVERPDAQSGPALARRVHRPAVARPTSSSPPAAATSCGGRSSGSTAYIDGMLRAQARDDEGWQRLDLCACCQRVGLLIGARATRQRVAVRINVPESEVFIDACPAQMQNALLNVAINALDAMPNGGTLDLQLAIDGPVGARPHQRHRPRAVRRRPVRPLATPPDRGRPGRRTGREQGGHGRTRRPDRIPSGQRRPGRVLHAGVHAAHRPLSGPPPCLTRCWSTTTATRSTRWPSW